MQTRLFQAARTGDDAELQRLLLAVPHRDDANTFFDALDEQGDSALTIACKELVKLKPDDSRRHDFYKFIERLILVTTVDLNHVNPQQDTALLILLLSLIRLEKNAKPEGRVSSVLNYRLNEEYKLIVALSDNGADLEFPPDAKNTPQQLLDEFEKPSSTYNALDKQFQWIAQHAASFQVECKVLVEKKESMRITNPLWGTPRRFRFLSEQLLTKPVITGLYFEFPYPIIPVGADDEDVNDEKEVKQTAINRARMPQAWNEEKACDLLLTLRADQAAALETLEMKYFDVDQSNVVLEKLVSAFERLSRLYFLAVTMCQLTHDIAVLQVDAAMVLFPYWQQAFKDHSSLRVLTVLNDLIFPARFYSVGPLLKISSVRQLNLMTTDVIIRSIEILEELKHPLAVNIQLRIPSDTWSVFARDEEKVFYKGLNHNFYVQALNWPHPQDEATRRIVSDMHQIIAFNQVGVNQGVVDQVLMKPYLSDFGDSAQIILGYAANTVAEMANERMRAFCMRSIPLRLRSLLDVNISEVQEEDKKSDAKRWRVRLFPKDENYRHDERLNREVSIQFSEDDYVVMQQKNARKKIRQECFLMAMSLKQYNGQYWFCDATLEMHNHHADDRGLAQLTVMLEKLSAHLPRIISAEFELSENKQASADYVQFDRDRMIPFSNEFSYFKERNRQAFFDEKSGQVALREQFGLMNYLAQALNKRSVSQDARVTILKKLFLGNHYVYFYRDATAEVLEDLAALYAYLDNFSVSPVQQFLWHIPSAKNMLVILKALALPGHELREFCARFYLSVDLGNLPDRLSQIAKIATIRSQLMSRFDAKANQPVVDIDECFNWMNSPERLPKESDADWQTHKFILLQFVDALQKGNEDSFLKWGRVAQEIEMDFNFADDDGDTLLMLACHELVKLAPGDPKRELIFNFIKESIYCVTIRLNVCNQFNETPLLILLKSKHHQSSETSDECKLIQMLSANGADSAMLYDDNHEVFADLDPDSSMYKTLDQQFKWVAANLENFRAESKALAEAKDAVVRISNPLWGTPRRFHFLCQQLSTLPNLSACDIDLNYPARMRFQFRVNVADVKANATMVTREQLKAWVQDAKSISETFDIVARQVESRSAASGLRVFGLMSDAPVANQSTPAAAPAVPSPSH